MAKRKEERKKWTYFSETKGREVEVYCTRREYLFLKWCYDINGLSEEEYREYKNGR